MYSFELTFNVFCTLETHREEDDFFIPQDLDLEDIHPTVHLLNEQNVLYEANNQSPDRQTDVNSLYDDITDYEQEQRNTPVRPQMEPDTCKRDSSSNSFHTPMGAVDDKENYTPSMRFGSQKQSSKFGSKIPTYSAPAAGFAFKKPEDGQAQIVNELQQGTKIQKSLIAQLDKLYLLTDDEERVSKTTKDETCNAGAGISTLENTTTISDYYENYSTFSVSKIGFLCDESSISAPNAVCSREGDILVSYSFF